MSKLLPGTAGAKVKAKKVKNCGKKALSYETPTYHNSKGHRRPFLLSFVRIKDAGENLLSHILKLTPLVYSPVPSPGVGVKEALSAKSSAARRRNNFGTEFKLAFFIAAPYKR